MDDDTNHIKIDKGIKKCSFRIFGRKILLNF